MTLGQVAFWGLCPWVLWMKALLSAAQLGVAWVVVGPGDLPTAGSGPAGVPSMVLCHRGQGC